MKPPQLPIMHCLRQTFELYFRHWKLILGLTLLVDLPASLLANWLTGATHGDDLSSCLHASKLQAIISLPAVAACLNALKKAEGGQSAPFWSSLRYGLRTSPAVFGLHFLAGLAIVSSLLFLVFPGICVATLLSLCTVILVCEECSISAALERSQQRVRPVFWRALAFWSVLGFVVLICQVGLAALTLAVTWSGICPAQVTDGAAWEMLYESLSAYFSLSLTVGGYVLWRQLALAPAEPEASDAEVEGVGLTPVEPPV